MESNTNYAQIGDNGSDSKLTLKKANFFYAAQFLLFAILCFIIVNVKNSWIRKISKIEGSSQAAIGCSFSMRVSFALFLWYFAHSVISIGNKDLNDSCQYMIHTSFLIMHEVLLVALIFGCFFIPEKFSPIYFKIAIFITALYLVFQLLTLIDMFDKFNEKFLQEESYALPIIILVILMGSAIAVFVLCFLYFKCTESYAITGVNLALCTILMIAAALNEDQSVLTASMVTFYVSYLTFSGLMADTECTSFSKQKCGIIFQVLSVVLTLAFLCWNSFSLSGQINIFSCEDVEENRFSLAYFHAIFATSSCYLAMLVTNWGDPNGSGLWCTGTGRWTKWAAVSAAWVSLTLYAWGFVARRCCPERDFD